MIADSLSYRIVQPEQAAKLARITAIYIPIDNYRGGRAGSGWGFVLKAARVLELARPIWRRVCGQVTFSRERREHIVCGHVGC